MPYRTTFTSAAAATSWGSMVLLPRESAPPAAASNRVSDFLPSEPAKRIRSSRAWVSNWNFVSSPRASLRARSKMVSISVADKGRSCSTKDLDSKGEITENAGFSVVAAISTTQRFSTAGSKESCWDLENLCTSSRKSKVSRPVDAKRCLAALMTSRTSFTPAFIAESWAYSRSPAAAMRKAKVVFPVPGGPHRIAEEVSSWSPASKRLSGELALSRCD